MTPNQDGLSGTEPVAGADTAPTTAFDITRDVTRGTARLLGDLGLAVIVELPLANGRRVDIIGIDRAGLVTIVEVKASLADFRGDRKWPEYLEFCDCFYFAVAPDFPRDAIPVDERCGLIIADRFAGEVLRPAALNKLSGARRKAMTLRFARTAAQRLYAWLDPGL